MRLTVKGLRDAIKRRDFNDFVLQEYAKHFARLLKDDEKLNLVAEMAYKHYLRLGAEKLNIDLRDLSAVITMELRK